MDLCGIKRVTLALLALFTLAATPALAAWRQAETRHFVIYSEGDERALKKFAERLEGVHHLLLLATAQTDAKTRIAKVQVFLVPDVGDVQRLIGRPGSNVAGYYHPTPLGAMAIVPRYTDGDGTFTGQVVLFHEYAHHFMLQYLPAAYPAWLVEGFAEVVSTASFERPGTITYGKAASHRQYEVQNGDWIPLPKLLDGSYRDKPYDETGFYGQSWLLTHYLTFSTARAGQLRRFIAATNAGQPTAEATKVFGDLPTLQRELRSYAASGTFPYKAPVLPADVAGPIAITTLSPGAAAVIEDRIVLEDRVTLPDEKAPTYTAEKAKRDAWLQALEAKAVRYAADPDVVQLLADARCSAEDYAGCGSAADKLLVLAPGSAHALMRRAEATLGAIGDAAGKADLPRIAAARALIVRANRAAPDDPLPLIAYWRSFGQVGERAPAVAVDGLVQAMLTMPQVDGLRLNVAQELASRNRIDEARIVLEPLAYAPHASPSQRAAKAMLDGLTAKPKPAVKP